MVYVAPIVNLRRPAARSPHRHDGTFL